MDEEFRRQRACGAGYAGEVFKNRDRHSVADGDREEHRVANLYRSAHDVDGTVLLDGEPVWLLGYQWPNQGGVREKSRRADLVGLTREGALVVFEAKRADGDPPLIALLEGLDYLACLLRPANFGKIQRGFEEWVREGKAIPEGFETSSPTSAQRPKLVILAPETYFLGRQTRSDRGKDWLEYAALGDSFMESVQVMFAASDFSDRTLTRLPTSGKPRAAAS